MTTIACDGRSMAGDGLVTSNGTVFNTTFQKVRRLNDGRLAGCSGSAFDIESFCAWLENGGAPPSLTEDSFDALVLAPDGKCRSYDHRGRSIPEETPTASGSGRELAIGAMLAGASAAKAVEIAAARDIATGGTVNVFTLEKAK